jgi:hypothetical protein
MQRRAAVRRADPASSGFLPLSPEGVQHTLSINIYLVTSVFSTTEHAVVDGIDKRGAYGTCITAFLRPARVADRKRRTAVRCCG